MEKDDERKLEKEERRNGGIKEKQENRANVRGCAQTREHIDLYFMMDWTERMLVTLTGKDKRSIR